MRLLAIVVLSIVLILIVLVGVVALVGSRLPKAHVASRSAKLPQPPREVYAFVRDFSSAPAWRADVKHVELLTLPDGKPGFREDGKNGKVTYELSEDVPGQRLVTSITDLDLGYSGNWTYSFVEENGGTRLTITENGEVSNVIFRFASRYVFGHTATLDAYMTSLTAKLNGTKL